MTYEEAEHTLEIYSLEDILELNDCTSEDLLCFLVDQEFLVLPTPEPL